MGRMGSFQARDLERLRDELEKLDKNADAFLQSCAKELAARLLRLAVKRTPVGDYSGKPYACATGKQHKGHKVPGKVGGTLRRGWTGGSRLSVKGFADTLAVHHFGDSYVIEIVNQVEYATYVEYGHRTANHKGWVGGHFMMTISERELERIAPGVLEKKIEKHLRGCLK